jgi:hypothetical protein
MTGSFPGGVWIKGFVFHIYASSVLRPWQACSWNYSSCMGVTVSQQVVGSNFDILPSSRSISPMALSIRMAKMVSTYSKCPLLLRKIWP